MDPARRKVWRRVRVQQSYSIMNYDILWYDMIYYDTLYVYILNIYIYINIKYTYVTTFWLVSQCSWNTLCWFSHHWLVDSLVPGGLFAWGFICTQPQKTGWNILSHCVVDKIEVLLHQERSEIQIQVKLLLFAKKSCLLQDCTGCAFPVGAEWWTSNSHRYRCPVQDIFNSWHATLRCTTGAKLKHVLTFISLWHALSLVRGATEGNQNWLSATLAHWECSCDLSLSKVRLVFFFNQALHLNGDMNKMLKNVRSIMDSDVPKKPGIVDSRSEQVARRTTSRCESVDFSFVSKMFEVEESWICCAFQSMSIHTDPPLWMFCNVCNVII